MKKKIFSIVLLAGAMVFSVGQLSAACSGTTTESPITLCGMEEQNEAQSQALANCCEGSQIFWHDPCSGVSGSWTVLQNGPNSSCSNEVY